MPTDEELMLAYQHGDAAAFATLVERHRAAVFRFVCRLTRQEWLAEEVLGETFLKLHRAAADYQPRARFATFLFTIAYREALNALRKQSLEGVRVSLSPGRDGVVDPRCPQPGPARRLEAQEALSAIDRALVQLPEVQRAAFLLFYREELPTAEIAAALNIPHGSVRAHLSVARKAIRELLAEEDEAPGLAVRARR